MLSISANHPGAYSWQIKVNGKTIPFTCFEYLTMQILFSCVCSTSLALTITSKSPKKLRFYHGMSPGHNRTRILVVTALSFAT